MTEPVTPTDDDDQQPRAAQERVMLRRAMLFGVSVFILAAGFMLPKVADRLGKIAFQHEGRRDAWQQRVRREDKSEGEVKTGADTASPSPAAPASPSAGDSGDYWLVAGVGLASALVIGGLAYVALK
jgi:hypothetical protein